MGQRGLLEVDGGDRGGPEGPGGGVKGEGVRGGQKTLGKARAWVTWWVGGSSLLACMYVCGDTRGILTLAHI